MKLHAYFRSRDAWVIRRKSARDFVGDSLELRGPILWCFSDDVVQQAFDVDGYAGGSYPSPDESSRQNANASMSRVVEVKPWVFECKSPLQDREEFRAAQGLPEQFPNPDDAKRIFRFDDLTTELMDDHSLGFCECFPGNYGDSWPVVRQAFEAMPPGSDNAFVPPPQLLVHGAVTCEITALHSSHQDVGKQDCEVLAKQAHLEFFWVGEYAGISLCRLYLTCNSLQVEVGAEGQLFGLSFQEACAISNPEECWDEKRRLFLTGFQTSVLGGHADLQSGEVPCLFEEQLKQCHRLKRLQVPGVESCDTCRFAKSTYRSERQPLRPSFPAGTALRVSCHPDLYHTFHHEVQISGMSMTCVNGYWITEFGGMSMMDLNCQIGVQITAREPSSFLDYSRAQRGEEWFEAHYGKTLRSWDGKCLAPDHWAGEAAEAIDVPLEVSFAALPWGRVGHAQLEPGSTISLWNMQATRFLSGNVAGSVFGSPSRQQLDWAGLEDEISFLVVAAGHGKVGLYNQPSRRFLQVSDRQLKLSDSVNWEHLAQMDDSVVFKSVGSHSALLNTLPLLDVRNACDAGHLGLWNVAHRRFVTLNGAAARAENCSDSGDACSSGLSKQMTAAQTFVAQTLGHEFTFHLGGYGCAEGAAGVYVDMTDSNCQQLCGSDRRCGYYTSFHSGRCQLAETCEPVLEPRAMTFAKARQRVASGGNSTSNSEMANEAASQATSLLDYSEAEVVEVDATLTNLSTLQTAVNLSWYGDLMRQPHMSNDWHRWAWGPASATFDKRMNQQQYQQYVTDNDWGTAITMPRDFTTVFVECDDHVVSLLRTWRSVSQNLDFLANLVVDGEFLEAQLFQRAEVDQRTARSLRERLANETTPQLQPLMQHISQAFDLSQFLADMWVQGSFEVPKEELQLVQGAWRRVIGAARQLLGDASYGNFGGSLSLALLRNALEKVVDADVFNPPAPCNDGKHLLWKLQPGEPSFVTLDAFAVLMEVFQTSS
ncbi:unnamed protein product [Symbiodinium sp. KB8]|nr:unnamed protein product [Symbiodinium sp. KB8]